MQKQRHYFASKGPSSQGYGFSCGHVWMWELDCEEGWALKNWCFWTAVLEKTLESPLDCKEIQPVHSEGDQPGDFFGKNDAKAEIPVLWLPHEKSWLIGKDSDAGRDLGQKEKGMTEDEMAGWHQGLNGCEFEWTPGDGDGQGGLMCCDTLSRKESDTAEQLNWLTELYCGVSSLWVGLYGWLVKVSWSGNLCRCSGGWTWISPLWSAMKCPVIRYEISVGLEWLWAACILNLRAVFLRIAGEFVWYVFLWNFLALGWCLVSV